MLVDVVGVVVLMMMMAAGAKVVIAMLQVVVKHRNEHTMESSRMMSSSLRFHCCRFVKFTMSRNFRSNSLLNPREELMFETHTQT